MEMALSSTEAVVSYNIYYVCFRAACCVLTIVLQLECKCELLLLYMDVYNAP
jgi:hypothetical protein